MRILIRSPEVQYVLLKSHKMGVFSFCLQFCELIQQYGFVFSYVLMVEFIGDPDLFHPYISQIYLNPYFWPIPYSMHIFDLFFIPSIYLTYSTFHLYIWPISYSIHIFDKWLRQDDVHRMLPEHKLNRKFWEKPDPHL